MTLEELAQQDLLGKIWFMPTDTIPGLSCLATDVDAVEKLTTVKKRDPNKTGYIVLISKISEVEQFGMYISKEEKDLMNTLWPGPYTIVSKTRPTKHTHLTSVDEPIAFRIPDNSEVVAFIEQVGPIVSTSCNINGEPGIVDCDKAREKFGEDIDFYVECGSSEKRSSTIIKIIR